MRRAEVESKRRVIAEVLLETSSQFGEFSQDLIIPLDYFLFDKLHKRASIYPPALYSYVKTVHLQPCAREQGEQPRRFQGGRHHPRRAGLLQRGGWDRPHSRREAEGEGVRQAPRAPQPHDAGGEAGPRVDGYAGRVGFSVFKDEAVSKVKRLKQKAEPPDELLHPKNLLRLEEGAVAAKTGPLIRILAEENGFDSYSRREKTLGEVYSTARIVTIRKEKGEAVVAEGRGRGRR